MKSHRKYTPYVRKANGRERCEHWRMRIRLSHYQAIGKPFYVMVQRGFPNLIIDIGRNKRELRRGPLMVAVGRMTFRQWAKQVQRMGFCVPLALPVLLSTQVYFT